jgi:hypothetical protein
MNPTSPWVRARCRYGRSWRVGLALLLLATAPALAGTAGRDGPVAQTAVLGKYVSSPGLLLQRAAGQKAWQAVKAEGAVRNGDDLLALPGQRPQVDLQPQGMRLSLLGLLPEMYPSPALESAVRLQRAPHGELELVLKRGRLVLANHRKNGDARLRVKFGKEAWDIVLDEPGASLALERFNAWPPGTELMKKANPARQPDTHVVLVMGRGRATLRNGAEQYALQPLNAYYFNTGAGAAGPRPLHEWPDFLKVNKDASPELAALRGGADKLRTLLATEPVATALSQGLQAKEAGTRRVAVYSAGAVGDVRLLLTALGDAKHAGTRETAVLALRHWLDQGSDHAARLYQALSAQGARPGLADTFLHLLHTFSVHDRTRPETYDTLIDYLQHKDLRVRELARWQLYRMVPQGAKIAYDAAAAPVEWARARAAWRALIPEGQLPPRVPKEKR